jgi:hypothetical protein
MKALIEDGVIKCASQMCDDECPNLLICKFYKVKFEEVQTANELSN